jgi:hypothetical protein
MPDIIDAREAENECRKQRIGLAHLLRILGTTRASIPW